MSDDDACNDCELNMTGRMTRVKTSTAALDICNGILAEPQVIGVNIVGRDLGCDNGKIYLIAVAKSDGNAYVFDLKLNPAIIKNGHLKYVLETITVIKVMHRARSACLTVYKQFHFQIQNVFDTEIAHTIIEAQKLGCSPFEIELPSLNYISDNYGCGLKNKYRDRITACLKKNKHFFGHRPLSKPTAEFVAGDAALLIPVVFESMDQMINPCNRGLFNKLCSIRICADNEAKQRKNKGTIKELHQQVRKLKERLKRQQCPKANKKSVDPLCKRCGKPRSHHQKKKSDNCSDIPKHNRPQCCKTKTKSPCACKRPPPPTSKKKCKESKCETLHVCSRGVQTANTPKCPSTYVPSCAPTTCSSHCVRPPAESNHPHTEYIRCYGHTEDVPTSWQLVQVAGMDVDYGCLKKSHPVCAPDNAETPPTKCHCCDVACNTEETTISSSSSNECNENSDDCIEFETDSEATITEEDEECSESDQDNSQSQEDCELC